MQINQRVQRWSKTEINFKIQISLMYFLNSFRFNKGWLDFDFNRSIIQYFLVIQEITAPNEDIWFDSSVFSQLTANQKSSIDSESLSQLDQFVTTNVSGFCSRPNVALQNWTSWPLRSQDTLEKQSTQARNFFLECVSLIRSIREREWVEAENIFGLLLTTCFQREKP